MPSPGELAKIRAKFKVWIDGILARYEFVATSGSNAHACRPRTENSPPCLRPRNIGAPEMHANPWIPSLESTAMLVGNPRTDNEATDPPDSVSYSAVMPGRNLRN